MWTGPDNCLDAVYILCKEILLLSAKIKRHLEVQHKDLVGKDVILFAAKADRLRKCKDSCN
jgi:hypothetical protein